MTKGGVKGARKTPGSGRKKGTPNKDTATLRERCAALGVDPFEVLALFAKGDWKGLGYPAETYPVVETTDDGDTVCTKEKHVWFVSPEMRLKAAAEATQYIEPKRKALEVRSEGGINVIVEDHTEDR